MLDQEVFEDLERMRHPDKSADEIKVAARAAVAMQKVLTNLVTFSLNPEKLDDDIQKMISENLLILGDITNEVENPEELVTSLFDSYFHSDDKMRQVLNTLIHSLPEEALDEDGKPNPMYKARETTQQLRRAIDPDASKNIILENIARLELAFIWIEEIKINKNDNADDKKANEILLAEYRTKLAAIKEYMQNPSDIEPSKINNIKIDLEQIVAFLEMPSIDSSDKSKFTKNIEAELDNLFASRPSHSDDIRSTSLDDQAIKDSFAKLYEHINEIKTKTEEKAAYDALRSIETELEGYEVELQGQKSVLNLETREYNAARRLEEYTQEGGKLKSLMDKPNSPLESLFKVIFDFLSANKYTNKISLKKPITKDEKRVNIIREKLKGRQAQNEADKPSTEQPSEPPSEPPISKL